MPLVIGGAEIASDRKANDSVDPSRPGVCVARYRQATEADIERAVRCARQDPDSWRSRPVAERCETLHRVADELCAARAELMGAMLAEGGKTLAESDPEVSEAIDFCCFYAQVAHQLHELHGLASRGRGVVAVVSPWNFPLAIPAGGVAAALAAANSVILKPASDTVLIAYLLCQSFWRAGVPRTALQFAPCSGGTVGQHLVTHPGVDVVILTGGTETAQKMLTAKPTMNLLAETGGKNATIVTALSDRDLAIKNVLHSAFSHSGQKCSATSLLILESELYHDTRFREQFCDAVGSLAVGSVWDLSTKAGPLIRPPLGVLESALKELEPGEEWGVMPRLRVDANPHLVSPGVKWGVRLGSFNHCTEFFGPVLAVMEAHDLDAAIDLVNATGYGLTSGLESLDDREQDHWQRHIRAGNLYINRPTTGAIVLRQPFGGVGKSSVGPCIKAGGPNYVVPLLRFDRPAVSVGWVDGHRRAALVDETHQQIPHGGSRQARPTLHLTGDFTSLRPELLAEFRNSLENHVTAKLPPPLVIDELRRVLAAIDSYGHWAAKEFHTVHDHFHLLGEDNFRRYLPIGHLRIRVHPDDSWFDVFARAAAARAAGCHTVVSSPPNLGGAAAEAVRLLDELTDAWGAAIEFLVESDSGLAAAIVARQTDRVRYASPERVPLEIRRSAADVLQFIADAPPLPHGRVELLWYFQEQSLTVLYHRYGNLGRRAAEERDEPQ